MSILRFRVTTMPDGVSVDVGTESGHLTRVEAHQVAIALLTGCVPQASYGSTLLEIFGGDPDPDAEQWKAQWR